MLLDHHARQLRESAIIDAVRDARGNRTITLADIQDLIACGFAKSQLLPGLLIPQSDVHGENGHYQLRPDKPRELPQKNGKVKIAKYENPKGSTNRFDVNPICLPLLRDSNLPLWINEGSKKLDAGLSAGSDLFRCGVSIRGVDNWLSGGMAVACFDSIAWKGPNGPRKVYICLDNDPNPRTRANVVRSRARLAAYLTHRGAEVWIIEVPPTADGSKGALDDYLAAGGTIETLVASAVPFGASKPQAANTPIAGLPPDAEVELASRAAALHEDKLCYFARLKEWFHYDPDRGLWAPDDEMKAWTHARDLARIAADEYVAAHADSRNPDKVLGHAKAILSKSTVANIVTLARVDLAKDIELLDADPWLLNTPGGCVDLKTGIIRPATPADYFSKTTNVAPANIPTPAFDQFLAEIMGADVSPGRCKCAACAKSSAEPEPDRLVLHLGEVYKLADYIIRVFGYALTADVREHKLFLLIGPGGNGKGVLCDLMQYILGQSPIGYAANIAIEALLESKYPQHPTELMPLWHARLAFARESDEETRWNEGRVKRLTGGDRITARKMRQDFVEFDPTHKLVVFGQAKPSLKGSEQSAWKRRVQMLEFQQQFDDQADEAKHIRKADKHLAVKLQEEAPGVLYKLIQACLKWQSDGLCEPETVRESSNAYLAEQSAILSWIDERVDKSNPHEQETATVLWTDFYRWCSARKEDPGKRTTFNDKLERSGIQITRTSKERGICKGIKLKALEEPDWSQGYGKY